MHEARPKSTYAEKPDVVTLSMDHNHAHVLVARDTFELRDRQRLLRELIGASRTNFRDILKVKRCELGSDIRHTTPGIATQSAELAGKTFAL